MRDWVAALAGLGLALVELLGDASLKRYAIGQGWGWLVVGSGTYASLVAILVWSLKSHSLALTNGYWDSLSNIITMLAGLAMGEKLSERQIFGFLLVSTGILLL